MLQPYWKEQTVAREAQAPDYTQHVVVLCESGDIYSFGRGKDGQLGHGGEEANNSNIVGGLENETVIAVAAGSASSFAITSTGNVYQWYKI